MPFARKDNSGRIVALVNEAEFPGQSPVTVDDPEVIAFLSGSQSGRVAGHGRSALEATDLQLVRVVEDLIDLLVRKNLIMLTDLPREAQDKLALRQSVRQSLESAPFIADTDDVL